MATTTIFRRFQSILRELLARLGVTGFGLAVLLVFLLPLGSVLSTAFKLDSQMTTIGAPLWPAEQRPIPMKVLSIRFMVYPPKMATTQIAPNAAKEAPIARSAISEIFNAETEYLKAKQSDYQQEKEFIQRGVRQGDDEVRVLSEQQKREDEGFQSDQEELQKAQDLFARGTLTSPRVTDARRAALLSSTRKLQTSAQLLQVKKQQDELVRRLTKLDDQRRLDLLRELQDTSLRLNQVRERLQAVE